MLATLLDLVGGWEASIYIAFFVGVGIGVGAFGPRSCRISTSHISLDGAYTPCADGLLQTCKPYSDSGKAAGHALVSGVGQSQDSTCRARLGLCSHMRIFLPAVDEHSPATDTSVYSSALGIRVCGDEADGGSFQRSTINDKRSTIIV